MSEQRDPETDQPMPIDNDYPVIQRLIIEEVMEESIEVGRRKYGAAGVKPFNGRDPLLDLEQELRDALVYARQVRYERDHPPVTDGLRELRDALAAELQVTAWTELDDEAARNLAEEIIEERLAKAVSTIRREAFERGASPAVGVLLAEIQEAGPGAYRDGLDRAVQTLTEAHAARFHDAYQRGWRRGFRDGATTAGEAG